MSAITNTNPEQLIIDAIIRHVCSYLDSVERQFCNSDTRSADFALEEIKSFVFQSGLSYQSVFPLVYQVLTEVRNLLYRLSYDFYNDHFLLVLRYFRSEISALNNQSIL